MCGYIFVPSLLFFIRIVDAFIKHKKVSSVAHIVVGAAIVYILGTFGGTWGWG